MPKLRCTLLKRHANLLEDDGDSRKKIALNALGEKNVDVAGFLDPRVESNGEETIECRVLNFATKKGKAKAKDLKRKTRSSELPYMDPDRVSTRVDTKKNKKNLLALKAWGSLMGFSINRYYLISLVLCISPSILSWSQFLPEEC